MRLENLAVKHPYYCSESNYYSNEAAATFETVSDFLDEYGDADIDMNLCFRWDVKRSTDEEGEECEGFCADIFMIGQRKGLFKPIHIKIITQKDVPAFLAYLRPHKERLLELWVPL